MRYTTIIFFLSFLLSISSNAQISTYKSTDNEGLNKKERIDTIENYLSDLSRKLKDIESKVESSGKKISSLENSLVSLSVDLKKNQDDLQTVMTKLTRKKDNASKPSATAQSESPIEEASDLEKIKTDLASMKNQDLEKLKSDISKIKDKIQEIELNRSIPNKK